MVVPTLRELTAAGRTLAEACDLAVPSAASLLEACAEAGLLVIEPMTRAVASGSNFVLRPEPITAYT
jgi:hypothetical protein